MMNTKEFWRWFSLNSGALVTLDESEAAEQIQLNLSKYDDRLGVEISDEDESREVIITAGGDRPAFDSVEKLIADADTYEGWIFFALKPPMGFGFSISVGTTKIDASSLRFDPLHSESERDALGIRVFVPKIETIDDQISEIVRIVIQTGIGEKAFAALSHIEAALPSVDSEKSLPITKLGRYIDWHFRRYGKGD